MSWDRPGCLWAPGSNCPVKILAGAGDVGRDPGHTSIEQPAFATCGTKRFAGNNLRQRIQINSDRDVPFGDLKEAHVGLFFTLTATFGRNRLGGLMHREGILVVPDAAG